MLIRITQNSEGIEHYFETGQKQGRKSTRDMLDQRVYLAGNLDAFSTAIDYTARHKHWKAHYWHITASFAPENNDLDNASLTAITHDLLSYYYPAHDPDTLIVAAEAHRPKIQSDLNKTTGELNQRLLHIHLAISKLDTITGNQVRMIPFNLKVDQAFQSYLAKKYQLIDPADRKRLDAFTKANILQRWRKDEHLPISKQTEVARVRRLLSEQLKQVNSVDVAIAQLEQCDYVLKVSYKQQKSGKRYLQVRTTLAQRAINLRGKGFEHLEALYYGNSNDSKPAALKPTDEAELAQLAKTVADYKRWWLNEEAKRRASKEVDYDALQRRYAQHFEPLIIEQARYLVLYKDKIGLATLTGYRLLEKQNHRYLFNHELGVKIYDKPTMIIAEIPDDPVIRREVVTLMLKMAMAKGWNIDTLNVYGSEAFKREVAQQIKQLRTQTLSKAFIDSVRSEEQQPPPLPLTPRINQIDQLLMEHQQTQTEKLSQDEITRLKTHLQAQQVIAYAIQHYGLIEQHYSVSAENKIADDRLKSKPRNVVDFLVKTCNLRLSEAMIILSHLLKQQDEHIQEKIEPQPEDSQFKTIENINGLPNIDEQDAFDDSDDDYSRPR